MSEVRQRTRRPAASVRPRGGTGVRWRVASRLARRQVARTKLSSLLVVVLIALPIAGMAGFAVWSASSVSTPDERVRVELGQTQAWIQPAGVPDAGFWQVPDEPSWNGYPVDENNVSASPDGDVVTDPLDALPAGTETIEIVDSASVRVDTAAGSTTVHAWLGETADPVFAGRFDLVDGRAAAAPDEAMVTPATLERVGIALGDRVVLADSRAAFTVVGALDAAGYADTEAGVFLPLTDETAQLVSGDRRWYLPDLALTWSDVEALNEAGVVALSRTVLLDPPTGLSEEQQQAQGSRTGMFWSAVAVIGIGGAFAAYVVVMLAGAAFAVAARRQQRALAIVASVGATRRDLFRTVVLQGTTLGAIGGVLGAALGLGAAIAVLRLTDDGSGMRPWGLHIPWWGLAAILVFAVVVGTVSALIPARSVARADAIGALRGSRRPQRPTAARPIWGSLLLLVGVGMTIACAVALAAVVNSGIAFDSPLRWLPVWGLVAGPIVAQVGILVSGRWLLWITSRLLSRASTAARIASRDAAANASRTVPAFAAIGATVFLGVFIAAASSMGTANSARNWYYNGPVGSLTVTAWSAAMNINAPPDVLSDDERATAMTEARTLAQEVGATAIATIERQLAVWDYPDPAQAPSDRTQAITVLPDEHLLDPEADGSAGVTGTDPHNNISVIAPEDLATVLDRKLSASELAAYRAGAAIVTDDRFVTDGTVDIAAWTFDDSFDGRMPNNLWIRGAYEPEVAEPVWEERVDAIVIAGALGMTTAALAPAAAAALDIQTVPERTIATFDEPLTLDETDRLQTQAQLAGGGVYTLSAWVESGPPSSLAWLVPLLGVVSVLVVGASSVALGLARFERRPDDATLAAVGGTPALRRRIGFWQGLLIAGFGTLAGAVAGVLPAVGLSIQSPDSQRLADVPWLVLAALAVVLPLGIAAVNALVPPRRPDLTRRNVIA